MDLIRLTGISGRGYHGVLEAERQLGQQFVVDVELSLDVSGASASDDVAHTVDYSQVGAAVVARIEGPPVQLIETLAQRIVDDMWQFARVDAARVTVHKPQAPMPGHYGQASVTVSRARP